MQSPIDRSAVNRALAKAIAFKACGKDEIAAAWAAELVALLGAAEILRDDAPTFERLRARLAG